MTKEGRAVKAKRRIWNFSWAVVGLLVVILAAVLMAFMTCRRRTQETISRTTGHFWNRESILASPDA